MFPERLAPIGDLTFGDWIWRSTFAAPALEWVLSFVTCPQKGLHLAVQI
jgi:hypothetical protein